MQKTMDNNLDIHKVMYMSMYIYNMSAIYKTCHISQRPRRDRDKIEALDFQSKMRPRPRPSHDLPTFPRDETETFE